MEGCWPILLWWIFILGVQSAFGLNMSHVYSHQPPCKPGHYCPENSDTAVPCPRGTFAPSFWAMDINGCISCPPHHYAPIEGRAACLPCGARAQQPLSGQDECKCQGEGQVFQASDGQCHCALGYQSMQKGDACELKVYEICRDGRSRNQYGQCLDGKQWKQLCSYQVCSSPELYDSYEPSLGLCVCKSPPGIDSDRRECLGWCGNRIRSPLQLVCSSATLQLLYTEAARQVSTSEGVLLSDFKRWDFQGTLGCDRHRSFSRPVYTVQTGEEGFSGFLHTIPARIRKWVLESVASSTHSMEKVFSETDDYISSGLISRRIRTGEAMQVMNPIACLHMEDILLFTVTNQHYPQYDIENLFNTNAAFDWGVFRVLSKELTMARSANSFFSISFSEPGVYVLKLNSNQNKHMYVKVLQAGGECYDMGPFFPIDSYHMVRMGLSLRRQLVLRPDWLVIGGLLAGAAVVLCLCLLLLTLFKYHGWPKKAHAQVTYRALQLKYNMDDYSSTGSRVTALKKTNRNMLLGMADKALQARATISDDFWDYEEQVDLEAFSSSTFYEILLKHSLSVTAHLGQLKEEVKKLYQGVQEKMQGLQLGQCLATQGKLECLVRQVKQEIARRRVLGTQMTQLLDSQLQTLQAELQPQHSMHKAFTAALRECFWLLALVSDNQASLCDKHIQQWVMKRVRFLTEEMAELLSVEAQRQGCWTVLKQGTGAQLFCPTSGRVLTRDDLIAPDGSVRTCEAVSVDPCTGLIQPAPDAHMLLASGHSMPVPSDFFLHPHTGRLLPVAGNVGFDPASYTLVYTADACIDPVGKWEFPLLPFIPYPPSCQLDALWTSKLRGLQAGQRLMLGGPMCDNKTGVLVPILAVTIHPRTGMVYPVGGVHLCPILHLQQPIQIGCPMLDPQTGNVVLITGVTLDTQTGAVLPLGGHLLAESFIEPLSGKLVRAGGGSIRGGKVVPHAGSFQALLDSQTLGTRVRVVEHLRACSDVWSSGSLELHSEISRLRATASELDQAWKGSQHCMLQLLSRLEAQQKWAWKVAKDGGSVGEFKLPDMDLSLPALPGLEYPDPGGSGLSVPVLGAQLDWVSGHVVPLAGTMEDADGKGQMVDPVTGDLAPVVGARLDAWKRTVVPVSVSQCLILEEPPGTLLTEALKKECSTRAHVWRKQEVKEEDLVADLERALQDLLCTSLLEESDHHEWTDTERQLKEAASELQETSHIEAQRRSVQNSELSLLLPCHILYTLTGGDEEEQNQQSHCHSKLPSVLNRMSVFMAKWQLEQDQASPLVGETRQRELWEQLKNTHAELDIALSSMHWARELSQLRADTAEAMLSGSFWYKDYGLMQPSGERNPLKAMEMTQHKILGQLELLIHILKDGKLSSLSASTQHQHQQKLGLHSKQTFERDACSRAWTVSVPVAKGLSTHSLKDPEKASSVHGQNGLNLQLSSSSPKQRGQAGSSAESQSRDWTKLLELSPLFRLIQEVEQRIRDEALNAGLLSNQQPGSGQPFIDLLDAQWECEGELVEVSADTLNPREFLIYHQGEFLLQLLHMHKMAPALKLQLASRLPTNTYHCNAFRNSFYYQEKRQTLYVRSQRLQSIGGFSVLLLHCAAHISTGQLSVDSTAVFQRAFFKVLEVCLSELFYARLAPDLAEGERQSSDSALNCLVQERVQNPACRIPSENEKAVARLLEKHKEGSLFRQLESLLRDENLEDSQSDDEVPIKPGAEGQDRTPE